jgi:hypothetical protein
MARIFIGSIYALLGTVVLSEAAIAAPAVRLYIAAPCPPPTPGFCVLQSVQAGAPFTIAVAAVDSGGNLDQAYLGTWRFVSSDPAATLPATYTLVPADDGHHDFTAVLKTTGVQTITVSDGGSTVFPGTVILTVTGPSGAAAIPALSLEAKALLALILAGLGLWLSRTRD